MKGMAPPKKKQAVSDELLKSLMGDLRDETVPLGVYLQQEPSISISMRHEEESADPIKTKISYGLAKSNSRVDSSVVAAAAEIALSQAENLKMAQNRIRELEGEVDRLRQETELLATAGQIAKKHSEEMAEKAEFVERQKIEQSDQARLEMNIYRENVNDKDRELHKLRLHVEELESRVSTDIKRVRVRERELENRLELSKIEKNALVRAKDEHILELKRKMEGTQSDLEIYKERCQELQKKLKEQNESLSRTVRTLRLALTHLEVVPLKKAE